MILLQLQAKLIRWWAIDMIIGEMGNQIPSRGKGCGCQCSGREGFGLMQAIQTPPYTLPWGGNRTSLRNKSIVLILLSCFPALL